MHRRCRHRNRSGGDRHVINPVAESLCGCRRARPSGGRSGSLSHRRREDPAPRRESRRPGLRQGRVDVALANHTVLLFARTAERPPSTTVPPPSSTRRPGFRRRPRLSGRLGEEAGRGAERAARGHRRVVRRHHRLRRPRRHHHELEPGGRANPRLHRRRGHRQARLDAHAARTHRGHPRDSRTHPRRREGGPLPDASGAGRTARSSTSR